MIALHGKVRRFAVFLSHLYIYYVCKRSFYQDRLGTNMGKAVQKRTSARERLEIHPCVAVLLPRPALELPIFLLEEKVCENMVSLFEFCLCLEPVLVT